MSSIELTGLVLFLVLWAAGAPFPAVWLLLSAPLLVRLSKRYFGSFVNPWSLYCLSWLGMLILYVPDVFQLPELRGQTYLAVAVSMVTFSLGSFLGYGVMPRKATRNAGVANRATLRISPKLCLYAALVLLILGALGTAFVWARVSSVAQVGSVDEVMGNLATVNQAFLSKEGGSLGLGGRLSVLPVPAAVLAGIAFTIFRGLVQAGRPEKRRSYQAAMWLSVFIVASAIVILSLTTRRSGLITAAAWLGIALLVNRERLGRLKRSDFAIGAVLLTTVAVIFTMTQVLFGKAGLVSTSYFLGIQVPAWLSGPIAYVNGNLATLQTALDSPPDWSLGARTLDVFYLALSALFPSSFEPISRSITPVYIPFHFNTSPYLWNLYEDWGWYAIVLLPALLGVIGADLFRRYRRDGTLAALLLVSLYSTALVHTIRENMLGQYDFWTFVVTSIIVAYFVNARRNVAQTRRQWAIPHSKIVKVSHDPIQTGIG